MKERWRVRALRSGLQRWPFPRGRGVLLRSLRPFLPPGPFLIEVEPGIFVEDDLRDYMILYYFVHGFRDDPAFQLARRLVRPGDTVLDVGANVGLWLMGVARAAGPDGAVHAFEPLPANFARLAANVRRNGLGWVRCHPLAVADEVGEAFLLLPAGENSGLGSLCGRDLGERIRVAVTTVDDFCAREGLARVDLVKVDVEGAEPRVFQGAARLLAGERAPMVMFETGDTLAASFGTSPAEAKHLLTDAGYSIYRFRQDRLEGVGPDEAHPASEDLFAFRPRHLEESPALAALRRLS